MTNIISKIRYYFWFKRLQRVSVKKFGFTKESVKTFCYESWRDYFINGDTPEQAMREDLTYA